MSTECHNSEYSRCKFHRNIDKSIEDLDKIYIKVDRYSCETLGMHTDENTISWWQRQDATIRYSGFFENPEKQDFLKEALIKLTSWLGNNNFKIGSRR